MEEQKPTGSKIGNVEWGLVIGAVIVVDVIQLFLNVFAIGILANRFIDIVVGMALAFYFWMRGIKMNAKKVLSLIAAFVGEEIPVLDTLPLWTLDVILIMAWDKAEGKIEKVVPVLNKTLSKAEGIANRIEGKNQAKNRFNLEKPEGYTERKNRRIQLSDQPLSTSANFLDLNKTGQKITDESGQEKTILAARYNLSPTTELAVRGSSYQYRDRNEKSNYINAEFDKNTNSLKKMHFASENPLFAGRSINDMIERIPPGADILGNETSMSGDSFPLLLNTLSKQYKKDPGRFSATQSGEFAMNDQGKNSDISRAQTTEEKLRLLNDRIRQFQGQTNVPLSSARKEMKDGKEEIIIPKIRVTKNH